MTGTMKHRGRIEIIHKILQVLESGPESGLGITKLLFLTNLSHTILKNYLEVLSNSGIVEIRQPTPEQTFLRPAIRRYIVSTRKSEIFLRLYEESRHEDIIWWATTTSQAQSTIRTTPRPQDVKPLDPGEARNKVRRFNLFGSSKTQ